MGHASVGIGDSEQAAPLGHRQSSPFRDATPQARHKLKNRPLRAGYSAGIGDAL
jgi:hypothetical protein